MNLNYLNSISSHVTPKNHIFKISPQILYNKYCNINKNINKNNSQIGDLLSCLKEHNFDHIVFNKLIFNLDNYVLINLYRYIWVKFKLLKINMKEELSEYSEDPTYKYIKEYNMIYYKDYEKHKDVFKNYKNFVYNNLYTNNKTLAIFIYNTISQYLIS